MNDDKPTEATFTQTIVRAGRAAVASLGKGTRAAGRIVLTAGRGIGVTAKRMWSGIAVARARRAEIRIAEARTAAQARGIEIAAEGTPRSEVSMGPADDSISGSMPEWEPPTKVEVEEEPPVEVEVEEDPPVKVDVEEEPPADEDTGRVLKKDRARDVSERVLVTLGMAARWMGRTLSHAGKALGRGSRAIIRASAASGRAIGVALRRTGRAVGTATVAVAGMVATASRAIGVALRRTGRAVGKAVVAIAGMVATASRAIGNGFGRMGKAIARGGGLVLRGVGRTLRRSGDAFGRWIRRLREAWAAQPARPRLWITIGVGAIVVAGYLLAQVSVAARVAPDTTVLGVDVGGMSTAEARSALEVRLAEASSETVRLLAHDEVVAITPEELGLTLDVDATLDSLTGFSLSPSKLWHQAVGYGPVVPVVVVDESVFDRGIKKMATTLSRDARNAEVSLGSTGAMAYASQDAIAVNVDDLAQAVLDSWPSDTHVEVPAEITPPVIDTGEAIRFAHAVNDLVFSSPATLSSPNGSVTLTPEDVIAHGVVMENGSHFNLTMDGDALRELILERFPQVENAAVDASLAFDSAHQLVINPGKPARLLDTASLGEAATLAVTSITREGVLPIIETPAAVTPETLESSDFKELVATYRTEFTPREPSREHNIKNAASRLSGTILQPGESFSITEAIGPIDRAHGYISAGVIVGGVHTSGIGGGLCQIATTTYVAAYMTGIDIIERHSHSEWFSRYPAGRDAAIADGIDMRLKNDTPYALMFNAYVENAGLTVDIWSTPYYTVEPSSSGKYNVSGGGYRTETTTPCYSSSPKSGFSISDTRNVYLNGELVKSETRVSHYRAVAGVKCA